MEPVNGVISSEKVREIVLTGPEGSNLRPLPAAVTQYGDGSPVFVTRWRPDTYERDLIARGGDVFVYSFGSQQQPLIVSAETPAVAVEQVESVRVGVPTTKQLILPGAPIVDISNIRQG